MTEDKNPIVALANHESITNIEEQDPRKKLLPQLDLSNVDGLYDVKDELYTTIAVRASPLYNQRNNHTNNVTGILLHGKAGVGKTELLRGIHVCLRDHPLMYSKYCHASEFCGTTGTNAKVIDKIFKECRDSPKPIAIMLVDEIYAIGYDTSGRLNDLERLRALYSQMDGMNDNSKIIFIATTNKIKSMSTPLKSRFASYYLLDLPDAEVRKLLIKRFIINSGAKFESIPDVDLLASDNCTKGFTGRNFRDIGTKLYSTWCLHGAPITSRDVMKEYARFVQTASKRTSAQQEEVGW